MTRLVDFRPSIGRLCAREAGPLIALWIWRSPGKSDYRVGDPPGLQGNIWTRTIKHWETKTMHTSYRHVGLIELRDQLTRFAP
ncbi:hypothetical protein, partial [Rhodopirellula sallentina]|uniref:hypothetical protein n=1 Tax=Rhodopirellula sallentina TaxID=1263869 RepID=UPI001F2CEFE4